MCRLTTAGVDLHGGLKDLAGSDRHLMFCGLKTSGSQWSGVHVSLPEDDGDGHVIADGPRAETH